MELRHLRYFAAVAEALSFRRAAEILRVSQPALSKQIRDLEEEWGVRLFDRNTSRVRLTNAGATLVDEARLILAHAQKLPALVRGAAEGRRGKLTIGNMGSLTAGFLPASLTAFHARYPEVDVSLVELRSREQRAALMGGRIQIGLLGGIAPEDPELEQVLLSTSPLHAFVPRRHAFARRARISLPDLATEKLLAVVSEPGSSGHTDTIRGLFVSRGLRPPFIKVVDSLESLLALIASDQGISIIPSLIGRQRDDGLVTRPLNIEGKDASFSLWGVWRREETSQLVKNFVHVLQARTHRAEPRPRPRKAA